MIITLNKTEMEKERQCHITNRLVHSFSVKIRIRIVGLTSGLVNPRK